MTRIFSLLFAIGLLIAHTSPWVVFSEGYIYDTVSPFLRSCDHYAYIWYPGIDFGVVSMYFTSSQPV